MPICEYTNSIKVVVVAVIELERFISYQIFEREVAYNEFVFVFFIISIVVSPLVFGFSINVGSSFSMFFWVSVEGSLFVASMWEQFLLQDLRWGFNFFI
jgi:hypothetical protein